MDYGIVSTFWPPYPKGVGRVLTVEAACPSIVLKSPDRKRTAIPWAPIPFPALSVVDVEYELPSDTAVTPANAIRSLNVVVHPRYGCPNALLAAHV